MTTLRLAFIGCGNQASLLQANLSQVPAIDFVAACDLVADKARHNARRFGAQRAYTDFREMLEAERPDAVGICGPPLMHHEVGLACLEAGCHVFMEKPPALTADQTRELVEAAARAGTMGMVATHWRHAPAHRLARRLAEHPEFGTVLGFRCTYAAPGPKSIIWEADSLYRSFLICQVIHPIDCMRYLVGQEVAELYAAIADRPDGTTSYAVTFRFDGGCVGTMSLFGGAPVLVMATAVAGASGRAVEVRDAAHLTYYREEPHLGAGGYQDTPALTWHEGNLYGGFGRPGYLEELRHFAAAVLAGEQPRASLADAYENMRLLEAILASNASKAPVSLGR